MQGLRKKEPERAQTSTVFVAFVAVEGKVLKRLTGQHFPHVDEIKYYYRE